jgi:indolepyruvate ferredoxin oxidoreductase alpha subunit
MPSILSNKIGEKAILLGNEAIVRGALESGVGFAATYPGTPASEIGDTFAAVARNAGIYFEIGRAHV